MLVQYSQRYEARAIARRSAPNPLVAHTSPAILTDKSVQHWRRRHTGGLRVDACVSLRGHPCARMTTLMATCAPARQIRNGVNVCGRVLLRSPVPGVSDGLYDLVHVGTQES